MPALKIVTTGLAATYPFGGVFWDYLQYPLGFQQLGHEVLYVEDTGQWCYAPTQQTFVANGSQNARILQQAISQLDAGLEQRWFYRDAEGATYGCSWDEVASFCRSADLFLHISAACRMRPEYFAARKVALIDSDPMFTQTGLPEYVAGTPDEVTRANIDRFRRHDVFFTFGENFGAAGCHIPTMLFNWIPTRQPVVLSQFRGHEVPVPDRRHVLTTVGSWGDAKRGFTVNGVTYFGKAAEFERFLDMPSRSVAPLELATSGNAPVETLQNQGWQLRDAYEISSDPWIYRDYLANSFGEWSVAKHAYVASRSGWFSCRTACYLALGVPAVVQDTGFSKFIPTGEGVLSFTTLEEAAAAIDQLARDPEGHSRAARAIAERCFDSDKVLGRLLEQALA